MQESLKVFPPLMCKRAWEESWTGGDPSTAVQAKSQAPVLKIFLASCENISIEFWKYFYQANLQAHVLTSGECNPMIIVGVSYPVITSGWYNPVITSGAYNPPKTWCRLEIFQGRQPSFRFRPSPPGATWWHWCEGITSRWYHDHDLSSIVRVV